MEEQSMKNNDKIRWENVFYMICYCVEELDNFDDSSSSSEDSQTSNEYDLLAQLLVRSFEKVYKSGLYRSYQRKEIATALPYGSINIEKSYQTGSYGSGKLHCTVDKLVVDNSFNRVIKYAMNILINNNVKLGYNLSNDLLKQLTNYKTSLSDVKSISINAIELRKIEADVKSISNIYYKTAVSASLMIIKEWLMLDKEGSKNTLTLSNEKRLHHIWEKFLRRYIRERLSLEDKKYSVKKETFNIAEDDSPSGSSRNIDIVIRCKQTKKALVIDAKWYPGEKVTKHCENQAIAYYVIVKDKYADYKVSSLLIYAVTEKQSGLISRLNYSSIYGINVNQDFSKIKSDIDDILKDYLLN
jgi:5-methylcytosine-specific restriction endonuclease McrBC regulatory subunit McrC